MNSTTYQDTFRPIANRSMTIRISSKGRLAREGIMPIKTKRERGIEGTRFHSEWDIWITAFALFQLNYNPFLSQNKPLTTKEMVMVRKMAWKIGIGFQTGGFLGKKRCLLIKGKAFEQRSCSIKEVRYIVGNKKLTFDMLWQDPRTICRTNALRIDIQDPMKTHQNIQIQANVPRKKKGGKKASTTIATLLVDKNLGFFAKNIPQQKHVARKVKHGLLLSAQTGHIYSLSLSVH